MITSFQALILGIVQGLSEFIPVSSSGHLIIAHRILGVQDHGLAFDVALHLGTLIALLLYFYKDIWQLLTSLWHKSAHTRLAWMLILATIPGVIAGVLLESKAESQFRSARLVAINLILVGLVMLGAEMYVARHKTRTNLEKVSKKQALIMGTAQAAAVVPGVSRSGSTIIAGLFSGLDRLSATRFSFLLAIPITGGAILKVLTESASRQELSHQGGVFVIGVTTALISGLFAIRFMLRFLSKHTLKGFAYYRIMAGLAVIVILALR